ncbi:hypothetical protein, partial [uncultured Allofournierella sp.]|uniref:hypothetical protein n=1 Tax=uncultured Allofournierella sp. TaxID=1940258 RepID=UPI0037511EB9
SCPRFSVFFTSIFITLHHYTPFSSMIREKGRLLATFFDRLKREKFCKAEFLSFLLFAPVQGA